MMKIFMGKLMKLLCVAALCAVLALPALAKHGGFDKGGFVGGNAFRDEQVSTVAEALKMNDGARVVLRGCILNQLGKEKYTFSDDTGSVTIEIDKDDWHGVTVSAADTVTICGEVDRYYTKVKIEVDSIELYKQ